MDNKDLLRRLGLSKHESAVYLALLGHGAQTVAGVARESEVERPLVYKALPGLVARGLAMKSIRGKRAYYSPASPERLSAAFEELESSYAVAMPGLLKSFTGTGNRPVVHFYEGRDGIRAVYADVVATLPKGGVFYRYSSAKGERDRNKYVPSGYGKLRDAKKIERYVITNAATARRKAARLERATKSIPASFDLFAYDITQLIYGNKVAFVDYNTETAVVIENSEIARFQERIFRFLYLLIPEGH